MDPQSLSILGLAGKPVAHLGDAAIKARVIWHSHDTREARLASWKSETGKGDKAFDRIIAHWRKTGRLPTDANPVPVVESQA